jgi:lipoyl-dependent peroxiredoxin
MPIRTSTAVWEGSLKDGKGRMKVGAGVYEGAFTFASRFEQGPGTNPEELLGAAHAGCFSMALAGDLSQAGFVPKRISTTARVKIELTPAGFKITRIDLETEASVEGISEALFLARAEHAKKYCPVSQALAATEIGLQAKLIP